MAIGFCMKCQEKHTIRFLTKTVTKNNAIKYSGKCPVCGNKINLFMGRKKEVVI